MQRNGLAHCCPLVLMTGSCRVAVGAGAAGEGGVDDLLFFFFFFFFFFFSVFLQV